MQWDNLKRLEDGRWQITLDDGRVATSTFTGVDDIKAHFRQEIWRRIAGAHAVELIRNTPWESDDPLIWTGFAIRTALLNGLAGLVANHGLILETVTEAPDAYRDPREAPITLKIADSLLFGKLFDKPRAEVELLHEHYQLRLDEMSARLEKALIELESARKEAAEATQRAINANTAQTDAEQRIEELSSALRQYASGHPPVESTSKIGLLRSPEETKRFHEQIDAMRLEGWKPTAINHLYTDEGIRVCVWLERDAMPVGVLEEAARASVLAAAALVVAALEPVTA